MTGAGTVAIADALLTTRATPAPPLSVGILTADLARLDDQLEILRGRGVWAHLDIMDGRFCPGLTLGTSLVKATASCGVPVDVHLLVEEPLRFLEEVVLAGATTVSVHAESTRHLHRTLQELTALQEIHPHLVRGLALNPGTAVAALEPVIELVDLVLVLAVNPGWPGQRPAANTPRRIGQVRDLATRAGRPLAVGVDGGVTRDNVATVASWRPDLVVSGSAIFDGRDAAGNLDLMLAAIAQATP